MNHMWTKDEIRQVPKLWETMSAQEMSDHFHVSKSQLNTLVYQMKKSGFTFTKKRRNSYLNLLIQEVKAEQQ